ncbi:L-histidine N(alpha)-methyltransferase [Calycomorphotria hydatis]|nr:L-histidine N(alpha)-methyltransferase [Calycomorphotria hydatis]
MLECNLDANCEFFEDVIAGLTAASKYIPCKYLYDERGSKLFDQICELPEYYPTRTETGILKERLPEIVEEFGEGAALVEFGSGSSVKTRILLDELADHLAAYVPVDISGEHLAKVASELQANYPNLHIEPVVADFTKPFPLPERVAAIDHRIGFFPGSTIGNFEEDDAVTLLHTFHDNVGVHGGLLIGVDLHKSTSVLEAAYNDQQGVTAEFNLNLLRRINRELCADFDLEQFVHRARYNEERQRIEIFIDSLRQQRVKIGDVVIEFRAGEAIHTEYSHKFTRERFAGIAAAAGFDVDRVWTDADELFSVQLLSVSD